MIVKVISKRTINCHSNFDYFFMIFLTSEIRTDIALKL